MVHRHGPAVPCRDLHPVTETIDLPWSRGKTIAMEDTYDLSDLEMLARDCLTRAGVSEQTAHLVARDVALSEAAGASEDGFTALLRDIRLIRYGRLFPDAAVTLTAPAPSVVRVDAGHGFAAAAVSQALPAVIQSARTQGMAMVHLTRASHPGTLPGALVKIAAAGLAALSIGTSGKTSVIRPMGRHVIPLDAGVPSVLTALLAMAPPAADSPHGGAMAESGWLTVLDPTVTAAGELLAHLPERAATQGAQGITVAPELLAQIVNA